MPTITVESAESERASAYLSFASDILEANEITDYLVRVIQPRLTSIKGVQEAEILGGRTFAMRIWLDPARMAALGIFACEWLAHHAGHGAGLPVLSMRVDHNPLREVHVEHVGITP